MRGGAPGAAWLVSGVLGAAWFLAGALAGDAGAQTADALQQAPQAQAPPPPSQQAPPPPPPQPPPKATRVVPWRGTAAAPLGADTLDVHEILERRTSHLDSLLNSETAVHDTTGIDSLVQALDRGGAAVADHVKPRAPVKLHFSLRPLAMTTYDRVNGFRLGSGVAVRLGRIVSVSADGAYAFARERWAGAAAFRTATPWERWDVEAHWADRVAPFGPNQGAYLAAIPALVAGQDRQEYLYERRWDAGLSLRPTRRIVLGLRYSVRDEQSAGASTDFHFFGDNTPISSPNPQVDARVTRAVVFDGSWRSRFALWRAEFEGGVAGGALGGEFAGAWQQVHLRYAPSAGQGSRLVLGTLFRNVAGDAPSQAAGYLGGDATLRGYGSLEYSGRQALALRAEYEIGRDLLSYTGIPGVRALHLQFIPFFDAGTAWGSTRAVTGSTPLDGAWKSSAGLGIQRNIYYPGLGAVRLDISRRTDGGPGGAGVWFRIFPLEP